MDVERERKGKRFEIRIGNTGQIVHDMGEYVVAAGLLLGGEAAG